MECEMYFKVTVTAGGICKFAYSTDGKKYIPLDITFKAREGKWIGAKVGFYSITPATCSDRGWIDIISDDIKIKSKVILRYQLPYKSYKTLPYVRQGLITQVLEAGLEPARSQ